MTPLGPATRPTLYFIGVTTGHSSIMRVFPAWAEYLGLEDAAIKGIDFPLRADTGAYREAVKFIKADPLSLGALVTTHKVDLFAACSDLFDDIDPFAALMKEAGGISKRGSDLICHAKDPISSGLAIDGFLGPDYFARTGAEAFCMGAGGSAVAISWHLLRDDGGRVPPSRIVLTDRNPARLRQAQEVHRAIGTAVPIEYVLVSEATDNDRVLAGIGPGALVINATGLGKDLPGSPLTDAAVFPDRAVAWELNYRGELVFLEQARAQSAARDLRVIDGWIYFIHGWTQVISEVFKVPIDASGPQMDALSRIASEAAKG